MKAKPLSFGALLLLLLPLACDPGEEEGTTKVVEIGPEPGEPEASWLLLALTQ